MNARMGTVETSMIEAQINHHWVNEYFSMLKITTIVSLRKPVSAIRTLYRGNVYVKHPLCTLKMAANPFGKGIISYYYLNMSKCTNAN